MGLSVRFSARSLKHLAGIVAYREEHHPHSVELVRGRVAESVEYLRTLSHLGRPGARQGTREIVVVGLPYVIVYRIDIGDADEIVILAVRHQRMNT